MNSFIQELCLNTHQMDSATPYRQDALDLTRRRGEGRDLWGERVNGTPSAFSAPPRETFPTMSKSLAGWLTRHANIQVM